MSRHFLFVAAASAALAPLAAPATAQLSFSTPNAEAAAAPRPPRDRGPALTPAIVAAQSAVEACQALGFQVTAAVIDSSALPIVILSGDGAAAITQSIAMGKAVSALRNGKPSADLVTAVATDKALAARLAADPQQGVQRGGGLPIRNNGRVIGAIGISGSPDAGWDIKCAEAGLAKALVPSGK